MEKRDQQILNMYNIYWKNVNRAETALWGLITIYYSLIGSIFIYRSNLGNDSSLFTGPFISIFLILIISFSFSSVSFNLNLWFLRNMELISRIEKDMLYEGDLDSIIPKSWVEKIRKFFNLEFYCLFSFIFLAFGIIMSYLIISLDNIVYNNIHELKLIIIITIILFVFESIYVKFHLIKRYNKMNLCSNKINTNSEIKQKKDKNSKEIKKKE